MITVKFSVARPRWSLLRQTPLGEGVWGDCRFVVNEDVDECDFWVVYEGLDRVETCRCAPENTLFVAGEPASVRRVNRRFLEQFAAVWTSDREVRHKHASFSQYAYAWHFGVDRSDPAALQAAATLEQLEADWPPQKTKALSVISSDKTMTEGHVRRLRFVDALREHFGARIDVFGRGIREIDDKADAISPYRYHIALENDAYPDYWTEKIADAFLGGALPLYWGCPNLERYFSRQAFVPLQIDDAARACDQIEAVLESDPYAERFTHIEHARRQVLEEYNLFALIAAAASQAAHGKKRPLTIRPEGKFRKRPLLRRLATAAGLRSG